MMRRLAGAAYRASLRPAARRFAAALQDPAAAQRQRLDAVLAATRGSVRGRELGLDRVRTMQEFRDRVPVSGPRKLEPWLRRVAAGEPGVLSTAPVRFLQRTGGTAGEPKLLPATGPFLAELAAATGPWIWGMAQACPGVRAGRSYWSVSPAGSGATRTAGGLPIGSPDDTEYFGPVARLVLRNLMAVPPTVAGLADVEAWRAATLRHLAAAEDLAFVSVWSPSFLAALLDNAEETRDGLLATLPPAHAARVRRRLAGGRSLAQALWPRLALVSCWTDGTAAAFGRLDELRARLPGVPFQGKGLLATEGVVSVPWPGAADPVLAVASHVLEFQDLADGDDAPSRLAHELVPGREYRVLLSTSAGLLRHDLGDVVLCTGRFAATPTVRFLRRAGRVADLAGEKLDGARVERLVAEGEAALAPARFAFRLVAPVAAPAGRPSHYRLYHDGAGEAAGEALAQRVERGLLADPGYAHCRAVGQLGPVDARAAPGGARRFEEARRRQGAVLGGLKPTAFDPRGGWDDQLAIAAGRQAAESGESADALPAAGRVVEAAR